ncbi:NmrA/HSCARG family protein [Rhodococcus sp. D2-41]|uniref:NmrA/HSCARG family protein n=1 Tax=Speluncibacter jeojiensis TaxID=2710754 RepID=A0A9X4LWT9_9ACTN|nr:NmrA/HSCARG family protein [Rhodococcus sp. D2-41]MDG3008715.1 NmrA/HSCARG family protein [Rhodococcus sp. D2-41]MDG3013076.1 NmrA/HSCARG family protein [Corynebacteriales bacterium D3-21]
MNDGPILVLAATGGQGGAVSEALLVRTSHLRALVRDPTSSSAGRLADRGAEIITGSLEDVVSLCAAMHGVAAVYAMTTPFESGVEAEIAQGRAILTAARREHVPHLVFSSVAGADRGSGVPHFESKAVIEGELAASGIPYTILGPTYFFDNALAGARRIGEGVLELPLPSDRPLQQLARVDLGRFAARVLLEPNGYLGRRIDLAGDELTPRMMAVELGRALGRTVRHERVALEAIRDPDQRAMWRFLDDPGYRVDMRELRAAHPGLAWTSFAGWAGRAFGTAA